MRIEFRAQIDIRLGAAQRGEIFLDIINAGILGHHRRHHEAGIQHFAEAKLLHEIIGAAEQADRRNIAVDQMFHSPEQQAVRIGQVDFVSGQERL